MTPIPSPSGDRLYLNPPEKTLVVCVDEKSQIPEGGGILKSSSPGAARYRSELQQRFKPRLGIVSVVFTGGCPEF